MKSLLGSSVVQIVLSALQLWKVNFNDSDCLALQFTSCLFLSVPGNHSVPQFPYLQCHGVTFEIIYNP